MDGVVLEAERVADIENSTTGRRRTTSVGVSVDAERVADIVKSITGRRTGLVCTSRMEEME